MVTKKELVIEMKKFGIKEAHELMSKKELENLYRKHKKRKAREEKDKEETEKAKEVREESPTKKKHVRREKGKLIVPDNYVDIDPDDVLAESVRTDKIVVVFKAGAKIFYDKATNKKL